MRAMVWPVNTRVVDVPSASITVSTTVWVLLVRNQAYAVGLVVTSGVPPSTWYTYWVMGAPCATEAEALNIAIQEQ